MKHLYKTLFLSLLIPLSGQAQIDWARVERSSEAHLKPLIQGRQVFPTWLGQGDAFYYHFQTPTGRVRYTLVDAKRGTKAPLLRSEEEFVRQYARLTGDSTLRADSLLLYGLTFPEQGTASFVWKHKQAYYHYDRRTGVLRPTTAPPARPQPTTPPPSSTSPDGRYTIYGGGYDLYLKEETSGNLRRLTQTGSTEASFTRSHTTEPVAGNTRGAWWGHVFLLQLQDEAGVGTMTLVNPLSQPRPRVRTFRMPLPFDSLVPQSRLYRYDSQSGQGGFVEGLHRSLGDVLSFDPRPAEGRVYFTRRTRLADTLELGVVEVSTGQVKTLISEVVHPHINLSLSGYRLLPETREILWWSERSGYGRYYLYSYEGKLLRELTHGERLVAGRIVALDSKHRRLLFEGFGGEAGNPYYRKYYQVGLDGRGQRCLTPEDSDHEIELSPDQVHFVLKSSRMDLPPRWSVGAWGAHVPKPVPLDSIPSALLREAGWQPPHLLHLQAADSTTDLYGLLYLPSDYDPTRRYPIISNVYPGPQTDLVPRGFALDDNGNQSLAELGCLVMNVSPRGSSPYRGRDFYTFSVGRLRDYPLADDKYCLEQVARLYPAVDLQRVGIYGHSGGGFQTVAAMCTYPDFYKVGFAASGNHDNNIYINWWGEVFHGSPKIPTTIELAPKLQGKLMLAVGGMDNNVPPASTYRLAQALIRAGKAFDFFLFPEARHDLDSPYYTNLIRYYFARHLLGLSTQDVDLLQHR